ncbi:polyketide synthase dehydratase domain-containing protein [Desulfocastanea catecholica]
MSDGRLPLTIALKPWYQDHCFAGRSVLPAVETMLLLAARVCETHPEVDIRVMADVRFAKFLEIPPTAASLDCLVLCEVAGDGRLRTQLLSRVQCRAMSRIKAHGEVFFPGVQQGDSVNRAVLQLTAAPLTGPLTEIPAEYLYRQLVPFGPQYQTLRETLHLSEFEAWGTLQAPDLPQAPIEKIIGSPFPLDGAFHAACVLGQQFVDFVPFPVGFAERVIIRPTQAGCSYQTKVRQVCQTSDELVFDLAIFDDEGQLYETTTGLRMRDVRGTMTR